MGSSSNPALSASQIKATNPSATSGLYWIDPDGYGGVNPFQVYADMGAGGGGWMLALNSVIGSEPSTSLITSNTGSVSLSSAHTRALSTYSGQVRHEILTNGAGNFDAYHSGSYGSGSLPSFGAWTTLASSNSSLLTGSYGQSFSFQPSLQANWYGGSSTTVPVLGANGFSQGPASSFAGSVSRYSIWIRGSSSLVATTSKWLVAESGGWSDPNFWYSGLTSDTTRDVLFDANGTYTVTLSAASAAKSLAVDSGNLLLDLGGQTLNINSGGINIADGASLSLTQGTLNPVGSLNVEEGGLLQLGAGGTTGSLSSSSSINNNGTLRFNRSNTLAQGTDFGAAAITGTGGVTQAGSGTTILNAANTYSGGTTVSNGTLIIAPTGTINSTSGVVVDGSGKFIYENVTTGLTKDVTVSNGGTFLNNGANLVGSLNFGEGGGSVGGSNLSGVAFTGTNAITTGRSLTPGNSTGTATTGAQEWGTGGTYVWEINDATGAAGSVTAGWDLLNATGGIDVTAAVNGFTIQIVSLDGSQLAGLAANFDNLLSQKWLIADTDSAITSFALEKFDIDATAFQNTLNPGGFFSVARGDETGIGGDSTQIFVTYTVPEPSTYLLLGLGLATMACMRRRKSSAVSSFGHGT